jgi:hypothetical protein
MYSAGVVVVNSEVVGSAPDDGKEEEAKIKNKKKFKGNPFFETMKFPSNYFPSLDFVILKPFFSLQGCHAEKS